MATIQHTNRLQETFNPVDYGFQWTDDGWYKWARQPAHKAALQDRNARARELKRAGWTVRKSTLSSQLIRRGGIGSGKPDIEMVASVYMIDAIRE